MRKEDHHWPPKKSKREPKVVTAPSVEELLEKIHLEVCRTNTFLGELGEYLEQFRRK